MPPVENELVHAATHIFEAAVEAVRPESLLEGETLKQIISAAEGASSTTVLSTGKAGLAVVSALEEACPNLQYSGMTIVPHGYVDSMPERYTFSRHAKVFEAGHPLPDEESVVCGNRLLSMASDHTKDDLLLVLISGGTSALTTVPREPLHLADLQRVTDALLASGADIHQINTVRRQLTALGGGKLAYSAHPARVLSFVISDVVGDDLHVIGSGPTVADPTSPEDAVQIVEAFLGEQVWSSELVQTLQQLPRNPSPGDATLSGATTEIIGSNRHALAGAAQRAGLRGFDPVVHNEQVTGEAREIGKQIARKLVHPPENPVCHIWGGETTVTIQGDGKGGRNQEVALAAGLELADQDVSGLVLSAGTDGIDGPTDAAGAWSSAGQIGRAREAGLDPQTYLNNNDSYHYFTEQGSLVKMGPTHTNVMDVMLALRFPEY